MHHHCNLIEFFCGQGEARARLIDRRLVLRIAFATQALTDPASRQIVENPPGQRWFYLSDRTALTSGGSAGLLNEPRRAGCRATGQRLQVSSQVLRELDCLLADFGHGRCFPKGTLPRRANCIQQARSTSSGVDQSALPIHVEPEKERIGSRKPSNEKADYQGIVDPSAIGF